MGDPVTIAAVTSLASVGLSAYGAEAKGQSQAASDQIQTAGQNAGDQYRAAQLDQAAQYGELRAVQYGGQATRNLNITLGNIDATRAAAHDDPTSPTGAAVRGYAEAVGTEDKNIQVDSLTAQAQQSESDAAYLRYAGNQALLSGNLGATSALMGGDVTAGADILSGTAGFIKAMNPKS